MSFGRINLVLRDHHLKGGIPSNGLPHFSGGTLGLFPPTCLTVGSNLVWTKNWDEHNMVVPRSWALWVTYRLFTVMVDYLPSPVPRLHLHRTLHGILLHSGQVRTLTMHFAGSLQWRKVAVFHWATWVSGLRSMLLGVKRRALLTFQKLL